MLMAITMAGALALATAADLPPVPPAVTADTVVPVRIIPAVVPPSSSPEPLICHSSIETGSLIKRHKQCLTKKQWRYIEEVTHDQTQRLFDEQRTKPGCNGGGC